MAESLEQIEDVRRKLALEAAPIVREREAAAREAATPSRRGYWRSMGELVGSPSFMRWAHDEFPQLGQELAAKDSGTSRRKFLQLMAASMALAGLGAAGCRRPEGKIRPYNKKPVDVVIGKGMYYATTFALGGAVTGVLAETHEGRPTKIEGNPLHPNSGGGTDLFAQASILELYDPDRSRQYRLNTESVGRERFVAELDTVGKQMRAARGAGLAILLRDTSSPVVEMILGQMAKTMPEAKVYAYDPAGTNFSRARARYDFSRAKVIVSLDADILGLEDDGARYRRQFADGRRDPGKPMNRLYVVEPAVSQTGAIADHRLALRASEIGLFGQALLGAVRGEAEGSFAGREAKWIAAIAEDLRQAGANAVVVAGKRHDQKLQQVAYRINKELKSIGTAVEYYDDDRYGGIGQLVQAIRDGRVQALAMLHGNAAYDAPSELMLPILIPSVPFSVHLGLHDDETDYACRSHAPATHYLESWGLTRSADGTISVVQPMIEPMFAGMTDIELLARLTAFGKTDPYELTRMCHARLAGGKATDEQWTNFVQEGVMPGKPAPSDGDGDEATFGKTPAYSDSDRIEGIEICFALDTTVYDGRFANNAWLQECPDPVTKLTWDNAAILAPSTARELGVETGDVIHIEVEGGAYLDAPVFVLPGVAAKSITLPLGYGRKRGGVICVDVGFNAYVLRTSATMAFSAAKVSKTGRKYPLATTQEHWAIDLDKHFANVADEEARERAIIREATPTELEHDPNHIQKMGEHAPIRLNIYTSPPMTGANQWAMIIDLNACVGCNACVLACQSENNVPVVGKDEVLRGREMHWLRLDRYFAGESEEDVHTTLQPMMCQHCENAPCEPVCPVNATVHSPEGLNEMVYNRCIGTRYCSNNCPYKVRRFNFYDWNKGTIRENEQQSKATRDGQIEPDPTKGFSRPQVLQPPMQEMLKMASNPNVSNRMRGVMEKCTYCVQRIESAKIAARSAVGQGQANAGAKDAAQVKVAEGAVVSACAQVCPTRAIIFGDKTDENSRFGKLWATRANPRSYEVLEHLNIRPRTHYLAKVRNVNRRLVQNDE